MSRHRRSARDGDAPSGWVGTYDSLPEDAKAEVFHEARRGFEHPDPLVAAAAMKWARFQHSRRGAIGTGIGVALAALLSDERSLYEWWHDRRTAKLLIKIDGKRGG